MKFLKNWFSKWRYRADRITPSTRQVVNWCMLGIGLFAIAPIAVELRWLFWVVGLGYFATVVVDYVRLLRMGSISLRVIPEELAQIGRPFRVLSHVTVNDEAGVPHVDETAHHRLQHMLRDLRIYHGFPAHIRYEGQLREAPPEFEDGRPVAVVSHLYLPTRRGPVVPAKADVSWTSPLGLWSRFRKYAAVNPFSVHPDVTSWQQEVLSLYQQLAIEGRHVRRLASGHQEFTQIAEYTPDDEPRHINWAATARRGRMMKNVYAPDQGQHVIVAIDASRYMGVRLSNGKTRMDMVIESALALVQSAIRMGDKVSYIVFSSRVIAERVEGKGQSVFRDAVHTFASIQVESVQGGYESLLHHVATRMRRRALLIVLSELEGIRTDAGFLPSLVQFRQRNPVLFVSLIDSDTLSIADDMPSHQTLPLWVAAEWSLAERASATQQLQSVGVQVLESAPGEIVIQAVRAYIERRQRFTL